MEERQGNFACQRAGRVAGERPRLLRSCPPDRNFPPRWADSCSTPRAPLASPSRFFFFFSFPSPSSLIFSLLSQAAHVIRRGRACAVQSLGQEQHTLPSPPHCFPQVLSSRRFPRVPGAKSETRLPYARRWPVYSPKKRTRGWRERGALAALGGKRRGWGSSPSLLRALGELRPEERAAQDASSTSTRANFRSARHPPIPRDCVV